MIASYWLVQAVAASAGQAEFLGAARPPGDIRRVVSLAPNLTEMLFALGAGDLVVGVSRYDDYPPEAMALPKVGGFIDPSVEAVVALRPDLVVCTPNPGGKERLDVLERLGVPVLVLPSYEVEDVFVSLRELGERLGRKERAESLVSAMKERMDKIGLQSRALGSRPRVLMVYGHQPLVAAADGSFPDTLLEMAGGKNVLEGSGVRYPSLPLERVLELDPDIIIDAAAGGGELSEENVRDFWKRWSVLRAVREGRLFVFDSSVWFRPGPRLADGLEKLFSLLHGKS